jgi:predicted hydrocarbon binding protein
MNRKNFINTLRKWGVSTGAHFFLETTTPAHSESDDKKQQHKQREKFYTKWLLNLLNTLQIKLEPADQVDFMEQCGRECAKSNIMNNVVPYKGDLTGWLELLKKWIGEENVQLSGDQINITYSRCFCPIVVNVREQLPHIYCNCSVGWLKETFETVAGKSVQVRLVESIKRGADTCRFVISI